MKRSLAILAASVLAAASIGGITFAADNDGPPPGANGAPAAPANEAQSLAGTVQSFNYGPRGAVEGLILSADNKITQINFPPDIGADISHTVALGDQIKATVRPDNGPPGGGPGGRRNARGPGGGQGGQGGPRGSGLNGGGGPDQGPQADQGGPGGAGGPDGSTGRPPRPNMKPDHPVFRLVSLTDAKGKEYKDASPDDRKAVHVDATVKTLNYDPRGVPNGAQLDNSDLVRINPQDAKLLALAPGQKLAIDGIAQPLSTGGQMIDAQTVNGISVHNAPPPRNGGPRGNRNPNGPDDNAPPAPAGETPPPQ